MALEPNPLAMKPGDEVNPSRANVSVPQQEKAGEDLSDAVMRFLRDANKPFTAAESSSGIIWAEMCSRLNDALVTYRKAVEK